MENSFDTRSGLLESAPNIRQLSASVVNKIAAGEVIERPASIVKELIENSVDAGATRVDVIIEKGGTESIQVTDNGCGIHSDQLELAVASHATSKIQSADDLFDVQTLGFRGEALASIAEISHFTLRSRTVSSNSGFELEVIGGQRQGTKPCASPVGTTVVVEQMFFNTPVRRKFLRTIQTEIGHITEAFTRNALANEDVHFTLRHNQKTIYDVPACADWRDRIGDFFGEDIRRALIPIDNEADGIRLTGFVVDPQHSRAHNRMQYLFLNGRHIRDRSLQHALCEAYRGLLLTGRQPIAFLKLQMSADRVDVNVHPCKLEVRFQDGSRIYSQLLGTIRNKFLTTDLTARQQLGTSDFASQLAAPGVPSRPQSVINSPPLPGTQPNQMSDRTQRSLDLPTSRSTFDWTESRRTNTGAETADRDLLAGPAPIEDMPRPSPQSAGAPRSSDPGWPVPPDQQDHQSTPHSPMDTAHGFQSGRQSNRSAGLQIHNRYLVTQSDEGIVVIDQHALHERIIYEQIRDKVLRGKLESQRLLVPEPVNLAPAEAAVVMEAQEALAQIGIQIEPFGGDTLIVQAYPAMLANHNPAEMLRNIVELLMDSQRGIEQRDLIDELLHMISCKAAVKAGDKLSPEEIDALLQHRELCQDAHHCPHGRPTSLIFSREELDKRFKRI